MTRSRFAHTLLFLPCLSLVPIPAFAGIPPQFVDELIVGNLDRATGMAFAPDGRLFVTEQYTGRIRVIVNGHIASTDPAGTVPGLNPTGNERGLQGIAVDPRWPASPYVYVCYTHTGPREVLMRLTATGGVANPTAENLVLGSPLEIIGDIRDQFDYHNGGGIRFGPDGMLYVSLGEDGDPCSAQQPDSLRGKLLRLDVSQLPPGGGGPVARALITPADNPITGPTANARLVYAYGLRNPWRFAIDKASGRIILGDVGENVMEEVDEIRPGGNYGWPFREGTSIHTLPDCVEPGGTGSQVYDEPLIAFDRSTGFTVINVWTVYRPVPGATANWPSVYWGQAFFGDYVLSHLRRLEYVNGAWSPAPPVAGQPNPDDWATNLRWIVDFTVGPDGSLWYLTIADYDFGPVSGMVRRFRYTGPAVDVPVAGAPSISLRAAPNPSARDTELRFTSPKRERVRLAVFDLNGREVRQLLQGESGPGVVSASWDGRNARGVRVPPGLYLARLEHAEGVESARVLRLN
jgi:glucose/arabinose dehydrogenase